jgi:hypothetical protein
MYLSFLPVWGSRWRQTGPCWGTDNYFFPHPDCLEGRASACCVLHIFQGGTALSQGAQLGDGCRAWLSTYSPSQTGAKGMPSLKKCPPGSESQPDMPVRWLLEAGADLPAMKAEGQTPFMGCSLSSLTEPVCRSSPS